MVLTISVNRDVVHSLEIKSNSAVTIYLADDQKVTAQRVASAVNSTFSGHSHDRFYPMLSLHEGKSYCILCGLMSLKDKVGPGQFDDELMASLEVNYPHTMLIAMQQLANAQLISEDHIAQVRTHFS